MKKTTCKKPGQTKASKQRQLLAEQKRSQKTSSVPVEVLYSVFKYLGVSDLLRCAVVSKSWYKAATIPALWQEAFRRLPKACQEISSAARTTKGPSDWKKECIYCAKEKRYRRVEMLMNRKDPLDSTREKRAQATRTFRCRWLLQFQEYGSNALREFHAEEDHIFGKESLTARWNTNTQEMPAFCKLKSVVLFAEMPVFYDRNYQPSENSVHTRSLLLSQTSLKEGILLQNLRLVHKDDHVTLFVLNNNTDVSTGKVYFGLWNSSLPKVGEIAFAGFTTHIKNLLWKCIGGTSGSSWKAPNHEPVIDDVDPKYGLHGYTATIGIRNSRKPFYQEKFDLKKDGTWVENGDCLLVQWRRREDYVFYDIKEQLNFTWKTVALKGKIQDLVIFDLRVLDLNNEEVWNTSVPVQVKKIDDDRDNYSYENCELWELKLAKDEGKECIIRLLKDSRTQQSTIHSIKFLLHREFLNYWFGTSY